MLTAEKDQAISQVLAKNPEKLKELLEKTPAEVTEYLNGQGCECTVEEITEYGQELAKMLEQAKGELSEAQLDDVAGGKGEFGRGVVIGLIVGCAIVTGW